MASKYKTNKEETKMYNIAMYFIVAIVVFVFVLAGA